MKTSRILLAFLLTASACAVETDDGGDDVATSDLRRVPDPQILVASHDMRKCMAPMCGGYFVKRVNWKTTRCGSGRYDERCYVSGIDFSALGLGWEQEGDLQNSIGYDFTATRAVLQGTFVRAEVFSGTQYWTLRVTAAWRAPAEGTIRGTFYGLKDNGVRCITWPCPTVHEKKLNTRIERDITGVDLMKAPGTDEDRAAGYDGLFKPNGLVAAGENIVFSKAGPAGDATELVASQFFVPVQPLLGLGDSCGVGSGECGDGLLCCATCGIQQRDEEGNPIPCPRYCTRPWDTGTCPMYQ